MIRATVWQRAHHDPTATVLPGRVVAGQRQVL